MARPGRKCTICHHKDRRKIERLLRDGSVTITAISQKYAVKRWCISRHRDSCMTIAAAEAIAQTHGSIHERSREAVAHIQRGVNSIDDFIARIENQYSVLSDILTEARESGERYDTRAALMAIREMRESLRLYLDLYREARLGEQESKDQQSQKFDIMMKAVMEALADHPEARAEVVRRLENI